ncbi:MAG: sialate O-acetylesterase [Ignavibacteriaceae bacterium]
MKLIILLIVLVSVIEPESKTKNSMEMPAIFSDNMVLQHNSEAPFWGKAEPGENVSINCSWGESAETSADNDGTWQTKVKTPGAGGPYVVKIQIGDSAVEYKNVMSGEVWLCSGQSNMEMPMEGWPPYAAVKNSAEEIKDADYPEIRLFTVARAVSDKPEFNCLGNWSECNPKTVSTFSATAYFFGRDLYKKLNVPIGLIVSSWGGTKIQPWISKNYLSELSEYKPVIGKIDSSGPVIRKMNKWIENHPSISVSDKDPIERWKDLDFYDSLCSRPGFDDSGWRTMKLPTLWESTEVGDFDGVVWFRKEIKIPPKWINKNLSLHLGPIDDMDRSYVNGVLVGSTEVPGFYSTPRVYNVPAKIVKDTVLTIAVRVLDNGGGGGLWGDRSKMQIHPQTDTTDSIDLSGDWKYLPVAELVNNKFYIYKVQGEEFYSRPKSEISIGPDTPTMLYNGMIAPLVPYSIKGAIWYQGESNANEPADYNNYKTLFPLMIKNWRAVWDEGSFPFYYVQIAPFDYGKTSKSYMIREAQLLTLSVPNTGMAVTLDIGNVDNIHPADKQDVGKRLALWALAKTYGENVKYSGPLYKSMKTEDNNIVISFDHADDGLVLKPVNGDNNFIIAGADSNFVKADVKIDGNKLIVYNNKIKNPIAVRYAWNNTAEATLFNKEGLPASTFKTDNWKE